MKKSLIFLISAVIAITLIINYANGRSRKVVSTPAVQGDITVANKFYFLFLSDVHLALDIKRTTYGQDAGTDVWNAFKWKIDSILKSPNPPAFILYTGDMPEHGGIYDTILRNKNIDSVLTGLHKMSAVNNIPLFYLPGNNDGLGGDYCLFTDENGRSPFSLVNGYAPYPYQAFNVSKTPGGNGAWMISDDAALTSGYYAAMIMTGLRIISLNSVIWSHSVCGQCTQDCQLQQAAGAKQMAWLEQQLADAANAGDKVYVAMHVPPGADAYESSRNPAKPVMMWNNPGWQNQFLKAVSQYQQTIAGIFYGHTHMDEFRLLYGDSVNSAITQVAISCPGVSARSGNNPGFKLVTVDPISKFPIDFTTYYTTVNPVMWQQPYSFSSLSGSKPGASIYGALKEMKPAARKKLMDYIYKVRHGMSSFDTLGMSVRWIK